jgi:Flp pilus assembly secretin CpaC
MITRVLRLMAMVAVTGFLGAAMVGLRAEESDPAALATALKDVTATLQGGLKASEPEGKPISAKFELEDGKLQLSVYALKGDDFVEVVADPKTAVAKAKRSATPTTSKPRRRRKRQWPRRRCRC